METCHDMNIRTQRASVKSKVHRRALSEELPAPIIDANKLPVARSSTADCYNRAISLDASTPHTSGTTLFCETESDHREKLGGSNADVDIGHILIGIDFGTTYSGVAWAYSNQPEDIKTITDWDCAEFQNADKGKVPTKIAYEWLPKGDNGKLGVDTDRGVSWGYNVESPEAAEWFKLLLLDEDDLAINKRKSPQIKKARRLLEKARKTPVEAVTDYLRFLWNHTIENIEKDFGASVVHEMPFQIVCTVPAVWTIQAVDRMKEAAKRAGILSQRLAGETTLRFVSEPEAAALATLDDLKARPNFKAGDTFVVCDAGGGTVDLISYKVIETNPMVLAECVEGKGQLCGAVFMDQDFEALMEQLVGDAWDVPSSAIRDMMNAQWENGIKRGFNGQTKDWNIRLPHECVKKGAPPIIALNQGHIREIFDNVVSQIQLLVNDQIEVIEKIEGRLPKAVVLVGGFGSCRYLYNTLKVENEHRKIDVYQSNGAKPWTSISRGAVLKALTNSLLPGPIVLSRILRCSYGTRFQTNFDPRAHLQEDKFWYTMKGVWYATDQMEWYLLKGQNISDSKPHSLPWRESVKTEGGFDKTTIATSIYTCDSANPPSRRTKAVKRNCVIETIRPIDISNIVEQDGARGEKYKEVYYELEVNIIGTALEFVMKFRGQRVGHTSIQAEVQDSVSAVPFPVVEDSRTLVPISNPTEVLRIVDTQFEAREGKLERAVLLQDHAPKSEEAHAVHKREVFGLSRTHARRGKSFFNRSGMARAVPKSGAGPS